LTRSARAARNGLRGTGFDRRTLADLRARLDRLARKTSALDAGLDRVEKGVHWVTPKLVAEIAFTEWTRDGALRHPSFQGLREDKDPSEVRRERAKPVDEVAEAGENRSGKEGGAALSKKTSKTRSQEGEVAGVRVTSLDRELYPKSSAGPAITKGDLIDYYHRVADRMLPHVADRPLTLLRCPGGIEAESTKCFYQRHLGEGPPEALHGVDFEDDEGDPETYLMIRDVAGLVSLAQLGVLEIHPWASRADRLERPDRLIFDLDPDTDPDTGVGWKEVVESAHDLRELLAGLELRSWVRTTGGKGVHVVIPIRRDLSFDQAKALTRGIAELMAEREPDRYTTNIRKAKRKGRIFVDFLRNAQTATAIGSYSTRARDGAPVATPLAWEELTPDLDPKSLNLRTIPGRLEALQEDPWAELLETSQRIKKEILESLGVDEG
jgi:bifunctional non-homologous end joining protein LigD